jgi:hypothetical protein
MNTKSLAEELGVTPSNVTGIIDYRPAGQARISEP